jgi:hypothetical protein
MCGGGATPGTTLTTCTGIQSASCDPGYGYELCTDAPGTFPPSTQGSCLIVHLSSFEWTLLSDHYCATEDQILGGFTNLAEVMCQTVLPIQILVVWTIVY